MLDLNLAPTPKASFALVAGAITTIVIWVLKDGFRIEVSGEHAAAITTVISFAGAYFAPRSQPPPM